MEKRVAMNLAALRHRRNAVLSVIRALEIYARSSASSAVPPSRVKPHRRRAR